VTRVLLVDDHPMIGAALDMLLRGTGYEVLGRARNVAEANREIARLKPDLLLLDVNLPDGSGLDVLRRVGRSRARPRHNSASQQAHPDKFQMPRNPRPSVTSLLR